ncbi:MAG: hypothetical protein EAZ47_00495 [Bacteroidetes bacterium]|nr:MAG: hypothetical protein EAY72_09960 [Bacteroidota bacterium]TAE67465.1 MAG: hypothetical protein EAY68_05290 [Bacteroidota bacterium]TAF98356.1 MAG: hypothetical protein EAZ47_00495 [Bacteroidota bacterium]
MKVTFFTVNRFKIKNPFYMKFLTTLLVVLVSSCAWAQVSDLTVYVGKYKMQAGAPIPEIEVTVNNGSLVMSAAMGQATLTRVSGDTFAIPSYNGYAYFIKTEGRVTSLRIDAMGMILDGTKDGWALHREYMISITERRKYTR